MKNTFAMAKLFSGTLLFILCGIMLTGCATTDTLSGQTMANKDLPTPDMSDAASCEQVGYACFQKAWDMHVLNVESGNNDNSGNREQMQKLFACSVELLDHSLLLLKEQKTNHGTNEHRVCLKMAWVCQGAKVFYPDEPRLYQAYYEKAIRYLTLYLKKHQAESPTEYADLEYQLAYLYFLTGEEEKAFQMADKAWGDGNHNRWNQMFWHWLKNCLVEKKMQAKNLPPLPPLPPPPTLRDRLLFPLNLVPDVLSNTLVYVVWSPCVIGEMLVSDEPAWGIMCIFSWPYGLLFSSAVGVHDAWCGIPFWDPSILESGKKRLGPPSSYEYFHDEAP